MSEKQPKAQLMVNDETLSPVEWSEVHERLSDPQSTTWLATVRPDGRPHVVPVGAGWYEGALYFITGQGTQKEKNVIANPHCVITTASRGYDLVVEGTVSRVTDAETLVPLAALYDSKGWPATAIEGGFDAPFNAPTTGPKPYYVYKVTPTKAFALGTEEGKYLNPTRWRF